MMAIASIIGIVFTFGIISMVGYIWFGIIKEIVSAICYRFKKHGPVYYSSIYVEDTIRHDWIPAEDASGKFCGWYDRATNTTYDTTRTRVIVPINDRH